MANNCVEDWEDDWENAEIPDLIVNLEETIKNKERELKLLEERKKMEEDDLALAEDLFDKNQDKKISLKDLEPVKFVKKEKSKELQFEQEKRRKELQEKQKQTSQKQKEKKLQEKKLKELYGEADIDEYDEMYGDIEDKYC